MARKASRTASDSYGFTIVELLIVVVVIAILAAITIVAYNGITNRAKASAVSAAAEQAAMKVAIYMTTNGDQVPADLVSAGVANQNGTSFQYRTDTANSPQRFCITATSNGVSAFINNTDQTSPTAGACPGHGVDGGSTITNLAVNPALQSGTAGWGVHFAAGATFATSRVAIGGPGGNAYYSTQFTSTPLTNNTVSIGYGGMGGPTIPVTSGKTYAFSIDTRTSRAFSNCWIRVNFFSGPTQGANFAAMAGASTTTWVRRSTIMSVPAGVDNVRTMFSCDTNGGPIANDVIDVTRAMITETSVLPAYADGDSGGWAWNGTAGSSTSTGPAL